MDVSLQSFRDFCIFCSSLFKRERRRVSHSGGFWTVQVAAEFIFLFCAGYSNRVWVERGEISRRKV